MITKSKITITINKNDNIILNKYCEDNLVNKSKLIDHLIKEFLGKIKLEK